MSCLECLCEGSASLSNTKMVDQSFPKFAQLMVVERRAGVHIPFLGVMPPSKDR